MRPTKLAVALLLLLFGSSAAHFNQAVASSVRCGAGTAGPTSPNAHFLQFRSGLFGTHIRNRDLEFLLDSLYATSLTTDIRNTLTSFASTLVDSLGKNPLGISASDYCLVYEYFRRTGSTYTTNPRDTTSVFIGYYGGASNYNPSDRSHADAYIWHPSRDTGADGHYFSQFMSPNEDSTTGHSSADIKSSNAFDFKGPPSESLIDVSGTGWTRPGAIQNVGFAHEFQHALTADGVGLGDATQEMISAGAEAIAGNDDEDLVSTDEIPYTWSLTGSGGTPTCENVRAAGSNYNGRSAFMAYLAYNFRGADTTHSLSAINDDLMKKWISPSSSPHNLRDLRYLLGDTDCGTCANLGYFHPGGAPLSNVHRLPLLLHNWRVANFANASALDEGQYGYPPWSGFSPARQLRAWQSVDACSTDDIVAIPPEVALSARFATRDTTIFGTRVYRGNEYPMTLQPFGAEYWVIRSDATSQVAGQDLIVRVVGENLGRYAFLNDCNFPSNAESFDSRLTASVIGYREQSEDGSAEALWKHPEWVASAVSPMWFHADSLRPALEFSVPNFGDSIKAALLVISLADGPSLAFEGSGNPGYHELLNYRLNLALRRPPSGTTVPTPIAFTSGTPEEHPCWTPAGDSLIYVATSGGTWQLFICGVAGGAARLLVPGYPTRYQQHPDCSPRGDWVAFTMKGAQPNNVYDFLHAFHRTTGEVRQLAGGIGRQLCAAFQPNGQRIAYIVHKTADDSPGPWDLRRVNLDGSQDSVLVARGAGAGLASPRWSPDGEWVYFTANDSLYAVGAEGANRGVVESRSDLVPLVSSFDLGAGLKPGFIIEDAGSASYLSVCQTFDPFDPEDTTYVQQPYVRIAMRDTIRHDSQPWFYQTGADFFSPRWSPDGSRVAYVTSQLAIPNERDIFVGQVSYNHAPTFSAAPADTTIEGGPATYSFDLDASDPDGEPVSFSALYLPSGASINSSTGVFSWPHPAGVDSAFVLFRALDPSGGVAHVVPRFRVTAAVAPAAASDFALEILWADSLGFSWTAPGDDGTSGTATEYDIRWSLSPITEGNWSGAYQVSGEPVPAVAGTTQTFNLKGLAACTWYYVGIRTRDEVQNWSGLVTAHVRTSCNGGGGGESARRTGPREEAGSTTLALVTPGPYKGAASAFGATGVAPSPYLALEIAELNGAPTWRTYRLDATESATMASTEGMAIVIQTLGLGGEWQTGARFAAASAGPAGICSRSVEPRRLLVPGNFTLSAIAPAVSGMNGVPLALGEARHSRLGVLSPATDLKDPALAAGDTVTAAYAAVETAPAKAEDWIVLLTPEAVVMSTASRESDANEAPLPVAFALHQSQPNPFSKSATIRFDLPQPSPVRLEVLDLQGRLVAVLADGAFPAGRHAVTWDRTARAGQELPPGVYLYRIAAGAFRAQKKMIAMP